jgi:prolyl-tRNA synthetase
MPARMSTLFVRTLRENPADAELPSHRLLVRAGYIRRVAPGIYTWLPLGKIVLDRVAAVVRQEMDAIAGQEVLLPALLPADPYQASGRWTEYGPDMFRLADRRGADLVLGPTHEEIFAQTVKGVLSSWRDLPLMLYQIQTKYRDEPRPRAGILRAREFVMKDAYSFDLDDDALMVAYERQRGAYRNVFDRLGLRYVIVSALSGPMGGSHSEEFLATAPTGEDSYVACENCDYAANTEAVTTPPAAARHEDHPPLRLLDTPDTPTIETLVARLSADDVLGRPATPADTLKNVVVKTRRPGEQSWQPLVVGVPGDREVDLKRLGAALYPAEVAVFEADDFARQPGLVRGYIGPQALAGLGVRYLVDPRVAPGTAWITGANQPDRHAAFVVSGRDFVPDGTVEAAEVRAGDPCPVCGGALRIDRGIEVGHIFALGRRYADAFELDVAGPDGAAVRLTMGSYGIGVSRAVAAVAEQTCDQAGLAWPALLAPFDVHLVPIGRGDEALAAAERAAGELEAAGFRVLLDDRDASPGEKFADADLLGMPTQVVFGRTLAEGDVEVKERATGARDRVPVAGLADRLRG